MGQLHVHEFITLDGIVDAPVWSAEFGFPEAMGRAIGSFVAGCRGILLGRATYEMFEVGWSTRTVEDDPGAPFFNDTTKHVVSSTLGTPTWRNSVALGGYNAAKIRALKEGPGDLYTSGSATLVRALLADGLVDALHLFLYPVTRGEGPRLFSPSLPPRAFTRAACEAYDNGVVYLQYRRKE